MKMIGAGSLERVYHVSRKKLPKKPLWRSARYLDKREYEQLNAVAGSTG